MDFVKSALEDADVLVYMLEIGEKSIKDMEVHNKINNAKVPVIILLNKIDLSDQQQIETEIDNWSKMYPNSSSRPGSSLSLPSGSCQSFPTFIFLPSQSFHSRVPQNPFRYSAF